MANEKETTVNKKAMANMFTFMKKVVLKLGRLKEDKEDRGHDKFQHLDTRNFAPAV